MNASGFRPLAFGLLLLGSPALAGAQQAEIRAQVTARASTVLSSAMAGQIVELTVKDGDRFKKGDRLVAFDCSIHKGKLDHSQASEQAAAKKLEVSRKLDQLNSISMVELSDAQSALTMAKAETAINRIMVQRCVLTAPFSGRVGERFVQQWDYVPEGRELLALYDDGGFEIEMILPSTWLAWAAPGLEFTMRVDENGRSYAARLVRLSGRVDPVSQSIKAYGEITGKTDGLLPGMSGTALIAPPGASQ